MAEQKYASMAVEDMSEGGSGLFDNVQAKITGFQFTKTPPTDSYTADGDPIFANVSMLIDGDGPEDERRVSQSYSLGATAGENFTISEDGFGLIPSNDQAAVVKTSKFGTLIASLQNEGLPVPVLQAGNFAKLIDLHGKWKRIADKDRGFSSERAGKGGKKYPQTTLVCVKILALPGGGVATAKTAGPTTTAAGAATPAASTSAPAAASEPAGEFDLDQATLDYLKQVLAKKGGKEQRSKLTLALSTVAVKDVNRLAIARRGGEEAFLVEMAGLGQIGYDPTAKPQVVTLAA